MEGSARWLRHPVWDLSLIGFCWLPFYLWVVFGLGLGQETYGLPALRRGDQQDALLTATLAALGTTYVHRHYTFFVVYGDRGTFKRHARGLIVAPLIVFACVGLARLFRQESIAGYSPWLAVLIVSGLWNVWHSLQQRYGIWRVYAGRAGVGLEKPEHGRRDMQLLWASALATAALVLIFQTDTFGAHYNAARVLDFIEPLRQGGTFVVLVSVVLGGWGLIAARWLRHELKAPLSLKQRAPRLSFLGSTLTLFLVFVLHGPIVGYLCFGVCHALEYVAFVHHFGEKKFGADKGAAATLFRRPLLYAPFMIGGLVGLFLILKEYRRTDVYLAYYLGTSLLHFLFDGWIWKVRKPEVGRALGVQAAE